MTVATVILRALDLTGSVVEHLVGLVRPDPSHTRRYVVSPPTTGNTKRQITASANNRPIGYVRLFFT